MTIDHSQLLIGGVWTAPRHPHHCPFRFHRGGHRFGARGGDADVDAAVAAARRAFDDPTGWSTWEPARRADALERLADESKAAPSRSTRGRQRRTACRSRSRASWRLSRRALPLLRRPDPRAASRRSRPGCLGGTVPSGRSEPARRRRRDRPVELPQYAVGLRSSPRPWRPAARWCVKPSPETVLDAYLLAEAVDAAGVPAGVINIVPGGREVGAYLVAHPGIDKVAFTGSTAGGRAIAQACAAAAAPGHARARRQVRGDRPRRRRPRPGQGRPAPVRRDPVQQRARPASSAPASSRRAAATTRSSTPSPPLVAARPVGDALDRDHPHRAAGRRAASATASRATSSAASPRAPASSSAAVAGPRARPRLVRRARRSSPTSTTTPRSPGRRSSARSSRVIPYDRRRRGGRASPTTPTTASAAPSGPPTPSARYGRDAVQTGTIGINGYLPDPQGPFGGVKASGIGKEFGPEGLAAYQHLKSVYRFD